MSLRGVIQKRSVALSLALALLGAAAAIQFMRMRSPRIEAADRYHYFNLKTGELFVAPASDLPVGVEGTDATGVAARVYSCGACNAKEWKVAYIQSLTPGAQAVVVKGPPARDDMDGALAYSRALSEGLIFALPPAPGEEPGWVSAGSPAGRAILSGYRSQCGSKPRECLP